MNMPIVEGICSYLNRGMIPYHMPGHKQGRAFSEWFQSNLLRMDLTEVDGLDNLGNPQAMIAEAQKKAADAFGARQTFFLTNGATAGIHAMLLASFKPGDKVLVQRNVHFSVLNGLMLYGMQPIPAFQSDSLVDNTNFEALSQAGLEEILKRHSDVKGIILTSPDYFGSVLPLAALTAAAHQFGLCVLVDQAHGAHFPFSSRLPEDAGRCGADIWVHSAHKTLPALTQAACLHIGSDRIDPLRAEIAVHSVQTSSPSYMLLASLDYARAVMESEGEVEFARLYGEINELASRLTKNTCITMEPSGPQRDFSRIVLNTRLSGKTGYALQSCLRESGIQAEMADLEHVVLIATIFDDPAWLAAIYPICAAFSRDRSDTKESQTAPLHADIFQPEICMAPTQAYYSSFELAMPHQSIGRICGRAFGVYPPGIAFAWPGERIDEKMVSSLRRAQSSGGVPFGLKEGKLVVVAR